MTETDAPTSVAQAEKNQGATCTVICFRKQKLRHYFKTLIS